jgi:oxygen-independent coproporphyrinogen-3 oxidase
MVEAICEELRFRESEYALKQVHTIYFGGGTPSILSLDEINRILDTIDEHYDVIPDAEITLEANPDDLTPEKIEELADSKINRLSIGIQSFFEQDLKLMNRAHNADEAVNCIKLAKQKFDNLSIDLIYGIPDMDNERWRENLYTAIDLGVPHISSYALTVEDKTPLKSFIEKGLIPQVDDEAAHEHFKILLNVMQLHGYENYEFSNFGKQGYFSKNNTAYWTGKPYIGIGPSAHSFDGHRRGWNINNNAKYMKSIEVGKLPMEVEELTTTDRYNEYIMTGLRTIYGVSLEKIENEYGQNYREYLLKQAEEYLNDHLLYLDDDHLFVTRKGKFLSDGIAADLFMLNLS